MRFETQAYLPDQRDKQTLGNDYYDDTWNGNKLVGSASISSKFVKNSFVELYLPYNGRTDDQVIAQLCPDIAPAKKGVFFFATDDEARDTMNAVAALDCHSQRFQIYVNDSLLDNLKYRFFDHSQRKNKGLATIFDVSFLPRGEHALKINVLFPRIRKRKDTLVFTETDIIPFWKE